MPDFPTGSMETAKKSLVTSQSMHFDGLVVIHSRSEQAEAMAKILQQARVCRFGDFDINECPE
jgi:hypothetical protein